MTIDIETSTYQEVLTSILDLITFKEHEGLDATRDWGLLKCLVGIARKQAGISVVVKKDSLGDYWVVVKDPANAIFIGKSLSFVSPQPINDSVVPDHEKMKKGKNRVCEDYEKRTSGQEVSFDVLDGIWEKCISRWERTKKKFERLTKTRN